MKYSLRVVLLFSILILFMCCTSSNKEQGRETLLLDMDQLAQTKMRLEKGDPKLQPAFDQLIKDAEKALLEGPFTVTEKENLPPSGNKHDYASYSRYWWPDPKQPDGLPYIRRDGETNPESQSLNKSDRQRIGDFGINTETLGLAYSLTGEEKYAEKAAELIRVWFLDSMTYMNPNVNHSQCRPGHNQGSKSGVLDGRILIRALEGSLLIAGSSALSDKEYESLTVWAGQYYDWLTTNKMALQEGQSKNNHGSFYDVQAIYFALYAGKREAAARVAQKFAETRMVSQIESDGAMPEEMARTRPLFYSIYNLHAMFTIAHLAEQVDVDVWKAGEKTSPLRAGLDYIAPYADPNIQWPSPTLGETNRMELFAILHMANRAYRDGNYLKFAEKLPMEKRVVDRTMLAFPLMR